LTASCSRDLERAPNRHVVDSLRYDRVVRTVNGEGVQIVRLDRPGVTDRDLIEEDAHADARSLGAGVRRKVRESKAEAPHDTVGLEEAFEVHRCRWIDLTDPRDHVNKAPSGQLFRLRANDDSIRMRVRTV